MQTKTKSTSNQIKTSTQDNNNINFTSLYFVGYDGPEPLYHGQILDQIETSYYLVRTQGLDNSVAIKLIYIHDMLEWYFFEKQEHQQIFIQNYVIPYFNSKKEPDENDEPESDEEEEFEDAE